MKAKTFASYPYLDRQARFATLGPAMIVHPKRYINHSRRATLVARAGRPVDAQQRAAYERAVNRGIKQIEQIRRELGSTWQSIALQHNKGEGFVAR